MKIFNGKEESNKILKKLKADITTKKLKPKLAVFLIGDDKASGVYVNLKSLRAKEIGVEFVLYSYDKNTSEDNVIQKIKELNLDDSISGILVQLPLPYGFDAKKIISNIKPSKDADGFHKENTDALKDGAKIKVIPVLPGVILHVLKTARKAGSKTEKIKALVNSRLFGDVLRAFFLLNGLSLEFLVAKKAPIKEIEEFVKDADVLVSVLGRKEIVNGEVLKRGVVLIDAGITKKNDKLYGDFEFESCSKKASFITPVPGGIGPMTIAFLLQNIVAFEKS